MSGDAQRPRSSSAPTLPRNDARKPVAIVIATQMRMSSYGGRMPGVPPGIQQAVQRALQASRMANNAHRQPRMMVVVLAQQAKGAAQRTPKPIVLPPSRRSRQADAATTPKAGRGPAATGTRQRTTPAITRQPLSAQAQGHAAGLAKALQGPRPDLLSVMREGAGLARELRASLQGPMGDHGAHGMGAGSDRSGGSRARSRSLPDARTLDAMGRSRATRADAHAPTSTAPSGLSRMPSSQATRSPRFVGIAIPGGDSPLALMLIARRGGRASPDAGGEG